MTDATVALPVLAATLTLPAPTSTSDVTIGLPVLDVDLTAPAAWPSITTSGGGGGVSPAPPVDQHVATLYDTDGLTQLAVLPNAVIGPWTEENSRPGEGTFRVPLDDATTALITQFRIVQLAWFHNGVRIATFAVRIISEAVQVAVDGRRWLRFENQPGLLALLGDAVIYPEYGLNRHSPPQRVFGWMAAPGNWLRNGDWHDPSGYPLSQETTYRKNHPVELKQIDPDWIAAKWVQSAQPPTTKNYFRAVIPALTTGTFAQVIATADNFCTLYRNGEPLIQPDYSNPLGWKTATRLNIYIPAGVDQVIAGMCENGPWPLDNGYSPVGFIFGLLELDHSGKPTATMLKSNTTNWIAHDDTPDPGWYRAQIVRTLVIEAQTRGVLGCTPVRLGFTDFHDTNGLAWDTPENISLNVGTQTVLDAIEQLTEARMDVALRPSDMTLYAWKKRGTDKSATVRYYPGDQGGTLKSHEVAVKSPSATVVLSQVADTQWVETTSDPGSVGRIEVGASLGSATSVATAHSVATGQLAETSTPVASAQSEASVLAGPIPYLDFHVGDVITVPGPRNTGTMKARILAITVDGSGDVTRAWPEFVQDVTV